MRERILALAGGLRGHGVRVSVGEMLDAFEAVAVLGVERGVLEEALAACLVKDHAFRDVFDAEFARCFGASRPAESAGSGGHGEAKRGESPAPSRHASLPRATAGGGGASREPEVEEPSAGRQRPNREAGERRGSRPSKEEPRGDPSPGVEAARAAEPAGDAPAVSAVRAEDASRQGDGSEDEAESRSPAAGASASAASARRLARIRMLATRPFRDWGPDDAGRLDELTRALAARFRRRLSRRMRASRRGRLDLRRTLRRAAARGGVPLELLRRRRRPGRPDLLALVDVSWSVSAAARTFLALLEPAGRAFRRVSVFGYVDQPAALVFEGGRIVPLEPLDLDARSDFGRVLQALEARGTRLTRDTVLLVLGDARNNGLPPRADVLARLARKARAVAWLVPEPAMRWGTGDSDIVRYARSVDLLLPAHHPAALEAAILRVASDGAGRRLGRKAAARPQLRR